MPDMVFPIGFVHEESRHLAFVVASSLAAAATCLLKADKKPPRHRVVLASHPPPPSLSHTLKRAKSWSGHFPLSESINSPLHSGFLYFAIHAEVV